jgi:glycosyltransferase involved in cell wall biosynthesis
VQQHLVYLSGAPRVSTRPDAELTGPRTHVLGVVRAFEELGWNVEPFIAGDRVPRRWVTNGSENGVSGGSFRTLVADLVRLASGPLNAWRAWRELGGRGGWVYERSAVLQAMGWIFKGEGGPWIMETNAPLYYEAKVDRNSIVLSGLARWLELRAYRECDVLVCVSEALKEMLVREADLRPEKVVVIPNGVDTNFFDPDRYSPTRMFEGFTIGFVGNLSAWQALDLLLEALKDLRAEGIDASLVVVGDGPMRKAWEAQARRLGIYANVAFTGRLPQQEIPRLISGFDVGYSGQVRLNVGEMYLSPLKLYEYMAMAKPPVASAFESTKQVVRHGRTGFLFRSADKADLRRVLVEAYHSRSLLPEMGRKAREEVVAHHSWTARVRTLISEVEHKWGEPKR